MVPYITLAQNQYKIKVVLNSKLIIAIVAQMNENNVDSDSDLSALLHLQDNFINLVHSSIYHSSTDRQDATLTFEVHHLSPANNQLNSLLQRLSSSLINKKMPYELSLRDCFQRLLQADFLPLLRINRYQLTKLSLFGFDIYIEPLEAVLQILARLEGAKKRLIQNTEKIAVDNGEAALSKGWDAYLQYCDQWRISFNLYILDEYLRFGSKSFLKKDREILFTGIGNLYQDLIPVLAERGYYKVLGEIAALNNSLYNFHPSFDYFQLFTYLLPLHDDYYPVFATMNEVLQKCLRTNILTPLLFGMLRHRESFLAFIEGVDSDKWMPYLNAIIAGITINLKFRILEYEQILELFEKAVGKAGLLGTIRTEQITGKLEDGWRDAKQFFISAVKIGFNSGEVQTWKSVEFQSIGPRILSTLLDGMLLNPSENPQWQMYLENGEEKLSQELRSLSDNKVDSNSIKSWICQLDTPVNSESKIYNLIRSFNLLNMLKIADEYSLNFVVCCMLGIQCEVNKGALARLESEVEKINAVLCSKRQNGWTFIKDRVIELHTKYPPKKDTEAIITFYFANYEPKRGFLALLDILDLSDENICQTLASQVALKFASNSSSKLVKMKTFERQLLVRGELVNAPYEGHCILNVLASQLVSSKQQAQNIIKKMVEARPQIAFTLLNFPINDQGKLFSFGMYLIENRNCHNLLKSILTTSRQQIFSEEGIDLIQNISYPTICQQLCKKINQVDQPQELHYFARLLLWALLESDQGDHYWKDLLGIYFYILEKNSKEEFLSELVEDMCILAANTFDSKLDVWLAIQLIAKIEGKSYNQRVVRKRTLKPPASTIYFINELSQDQEKTVNAEKSPKKPNQIIKNAGDRQKQSILFWESFDSVSILGQDKFIEMRDGENIVFQEEAKALFIPQILQTVLLKISEMPAKDPIVRLLSLNGENFIYLINEAISTKNIGFLNSSRYTANINPKLSTLLTLQDQSGDNILHKMCQNLSEGEKDKISNEIFLQASSLPHYVKFVEGIQFMVLRNNFNWRVLVDYLAKELAGAHIPSALLQYNEFVTITGKSHQDYHQMLNKHLPLFRQYLRLLDLKLAMVGQSQEERQLRLTNELTFLGLLLSSFQMQKVASKLGILHRTMKHKDLEFDKGWLEALQELQDVVAKHVKGEDIKGWWIASQEGEENNKSEIQLMLDSYWQQFNQEVEKDTKPIQVAEADTQQREACE